MVITLLRDPRGLKVNLFIRAGEPAARKEAFRVQFGYRDDD